MEQLLLLNLFFQIVHLLQVQILDMDIGIQESMRTTEKTQPLILIIDMEAIIVIETNVIIIEDGMEAIQMANLLCAM